MIWSLDGDTADGELIHAVGAGIGTVQQPPIPAQKSAIYLPLVRQSIAQSAK